MTLKPGTRLGPYEILSLIGAGGMGEVYKARDTRLERVVALKVLPAHLAGRADLRERFEREARAIANLQHPNICVLYDIGQQDGIHYLVMEYLDGETLAQRLLQGPLPLDQVLKYATEISDALDKAHRQGYTHRDIKPGNVMLTKAGSKILDFGLAKFKQEAASPNLPQSQIPTAPSGLTDEGTILGTLQYMAPEQVEGKTDNLDGRTDLFAFGAVVYEMITGKKAFEGKSQASVIGAILHVDPPPMSSLQPLTPPALDRVVRKCLRKDQEERWQSARDVTDELKWVKESSTQVSAPAPAAAQQPATRFGRRALSWTAASLLLAAIAGFAVWTLKPAPAQPVSRLTITLPPGQQLAALDQPALAISPDGKNIVYVAVQDNQSRPGLGGRDEGAVATSRGTQPLADERGSDTSAAQQLYLRPLDSLESKPIAGTEGAVAPFFSPDGQWIGFFAGAKLKKVSVNGGAAVTLASAPQPGGASWSSQGMLAFQPANAAAQALQQLSQEGGVPQPLSPAAKADFIQRWPEFLPAGKAVLFAASAGFNAWINAEITVQPLAAGERRSLVQGGTQPRYAPTGHLLYAHGGTLMAAPFDAQRLELTGPAVPALDGVMQSAGSGAAQYSISSTGTLVYLAGGLAGNQSRLVWVSRNGEEQPLPAVPHSYGGPRISPDGRRVVLVIVEQEQQQVWVYDISRDTLTRLTFGGEGNGVPVWSPDGKRVVFQSSRAGAPNLFWQQADGSGDAERLTTSEYIQVPSSFSPDGQLLAFHESTPASARDIWMLRLSDRKVQPFLKTPTEEAAPKFSPDGKWLAYSSDESGRRDIYVQPYPGPGGKWQISPDGGQEPVWNPNGRELFYRSGSKIMAVEITTLPGFAAGRPKALFEGPYLPTNGSLPDYDVSPDGQRFLMIQNVEPEQPATQIHVVLNWFEELRRKAPVKQ